MIVFAGSSRKIEKHKKGVVNMGDFKQRVGLEPRG